MSYASIDREFFTRYSPSGRPSTRGLSYRRPRRSTQYDRTLENMEISMWVTGFRPDLWGEAAYRRYGASDEAFRRFYETFAPTPKKKVK